METPRERSVVEKDNEKARDAWWSLVGLVIRRRRFILALTIGAAVISIVISLLLPKWYEAEARVMLPESTGGGKLGALLGNLDPSALSLLGTSTGDYVRYMAILTSGTMADRVIERFNLMDEYDTRDAKYPRLETRQMLDDNVEFEVDREFDFLSVKVLDKSPDQAAAMANFFVDQLNEMNARLVSENAANYRHFVQMRYDATIASLDSAMTVLKEYQEKSGVIELEQQAEAFLAVLADYRAATFEAEVEYEGLVLDFGKDNPSVKSAYNRLRAAKEKEQDLLEGKDPIMPVAISDIPEVGYGYARALREVMIDKKIIEYARPLLEEAIFQEQKETPAVQVLDRALVPEKKALPKRMLIVVGATLSVFLLVVFYLVVMDWLSRNRSYLARRLTSGIELRR